ncbi:MAG: hypothetical protein IJE19_03310 [Clostridia bacterium]|nr:hypothetical protein [Clostridia bacterium]
MKAKDYIEKYGTAISTEVETGETESATKLISELLAEILSISNSRNCKTTEAVLAVVKEVNQKYNAIQRDIPCLKPNAIKMIMLDRMPELKAIWH